LHKDNQSFAQEQSSFAQKQSSFAQQQEINRKESAD
jgi:hypothetical protein